jgi:hypothetical protein
MKFPASVESEGPLRGLQQSTDPNAVEPSYSVALML